MCQYSNIQIHSLLIILSQRCIHGFINSILQSYTGTLWRELSSFCKKLYSLMAWLSLVLKGLFIKVKYKFDQRKSRFLEHLGYSWNIYVTYMTLCITKFYGEPRPAFSATCIGNIFRPSFDMLFKQLKDCLTLKLKIFPVISQCFQ